MRNRRSFSTAALKLLPLSIRRNPREGSLNISGTRVRITYSTQGAARRRLLHTYNTTPMEHRGRRVALCLSQERACHSSAGQIVRLAQESACHKVLFITLPTSAGSNCPFLCPFLLHNIFPMREIHFSME
jgi:hypothetical protein